MVDSPDPKVIATTTTEMEPKAGFKTSEFWISVVMATGNMFLASGAVADNSSPAVWIVMALNFLGGLGYAAFRSSVKKNQSLKTNAMIAAELGLELTAQRKPS